MKKLSVLVVLLAACLVGAVIYYPPLREVVRAHVPEPLQGLLATSERREPATRGAGNAAMAVAVASAERATVALVERTYGLIQSPAVATINARIASQITAVHVKDGQTVKAGDLLVSLDDRVLQAQLAKDRATLVKDQAMAVSATADMQRAKALADKQAGTKQAYDQALAQQKSAEATIAADQATVDSDMVQLEFTRIVAPIAGRLGTVQATVGDLVAGGGSGTSATNLMTITQMTPLKAVFKLPEHNLADIRAALEAGRPVPVKVLRSGTAEVLDRGLLDFIDSSVDTTSGTIAMSATIANASLKLWPGEYADIEVDHGALEDATTVPTVAVQPGQSGPFVWLVRGDNKVEARPVTVARSDGGISAIATGLVAGDKVVVEGQLKLKNGAAVKITETRSGGAKIADTAAPSMATKQQR